MSGTDDTGEFLLPVKNCSSCDVEFQPRHILQTKCKRTCRTDASKSGPSGSQGGSKAHAKKVEEKRAVWDQRKFIAVDGEGMNIIREVREYVHDISETGELEEIVVGRHMQKEHRYVTLAVGEAPPLENGGRHLTFNNIAKHLYEQFLACGSPEETTFVGFALGYDFTMWFKTLPEKAGMNLLHRDFIKRRKTYTDENGVEQEMFIPWPVRDREQWDDRMGEYFGAKWEFDILGMKRFKLRPFVRRSEFPECTVNHKTPEMIEKHAHRKCGGYKHPHKWMYVCDAFSFFQRSFVAVIDPNPKDKKASNPDTWVYNPDAPGKYDPDYDVTSHPEYIPETGHEASGNRFVTDAEFRIIVKGKARRDGAVLDDEMRTYNHLENVVLARVMSRLNAAFCGMGVYLNPKQWFGPGQAAQAWLSTLPNLPTGEFIRGETERQLDANEPAPVPVWARDAARKSYYGGWFEIFNHGPIPSDVYNYDINSAYPFIISKLPCLLHGTWTNGYGNPGRVAKNALVLVKGTFRSPKGQTRVGAMPHRTKDGSIMRPRETTGWHWLHEVKMAQKAGVVNGTPRITQWVKYEPCDCEPPIVGIEKLYTKRIENGPVFKNGPQGGAYKLVYNSTYGKMAQSVGNPKFANAVYASLITAGCRTMILEAIATHPTKTDSLVMVATDGIYFTQPHPSLDVDGSKLGAWDDNKGKAYKGMTLMMPGLYWDDNAREDVKRGDVPGVKSRGISARHLKTIIEGLDVQWAEFRRAVLENDAEWLDDHDWPSASVGIDFAFIGAREAAARGKWDQCGVLQEDITQGISSNPWTKRSAYPGTGGSPFGKAAPIASVDPLTGGILTESWGVGWHVGPQNTMVVEPETHYYQRGFGDKLDILEVPDFEADGTLAGLESPDGSAQAMLIRAFGVGT